MVKFNKRFLKEHRKIVAAQVILTALLVLMFQYIMGRRQEYVDAGREPDQTESSITLEGEDAFSQWITCEKDTLDGVMVRAETQAGINGALSVQVLEESGMLLAQAVQPLSAHGGYTLVRFGETVSGCAGKRLELVLRSGTGEAVALKCASSEVLGNEGANVCAKLVYKALDVGRYKISVYICGGILWLVLSVCLVAIQKKNGKPEYLFAFLYLFLGIFYMAINPLYAIPDEGMHFQRAYGISEGAFVTESPDGGIGTGSMLPKNLLYGNKGGSMKLMDILDGREVELSEEEVFSDYWNTALYSPFTYTTQVFGVAVGKVFSRKVFLSLIAGGLQPGWRQGASCFLRSAIFRLGKTPWRPSRFCL